jgi:hypothetical protein
MGISQLPGEIRLLPAAITAELSGSAPSRKSIDPTPTPSASDLFLALAHPLFRHVTIIPSRPTPGLSGIIP